MFDGKAYSKQYYLDNKEEELKRIKQWNRDNFRRRKTYLKQYYLENKEKCNQQSKQWRLDNEEYSKEYNKQWYKTDKGKIAKQKYNHNRRNLGFYPLNEYFKGSHAHHISQNFVIYIPEEIHRSVPHCLFTGRNMEAINKLAIEFL